MGFIERSRPMGEEFLSGASKNRDKISDKDHKSSHYHKKRSREAHQKDGMKK